MTREGGGRCGVCAQFEDKGIEAVLPHPQPSPFRSEQAPFYPLGGKQLRQLRQLRGAGVATRQCHCGAIAPPLPVIGVPPPRTPLGRPHLCRLGVRL